MAARLNRDTEAILQGTLDMLVLRALQLEPMHGWGITERIEQWSEEVLSVGQGTLYPALYRLERQGLISSAWDVTANNRRARYYKLTAAGRPARRARARVVAAAVARHQSGAARHRNIGALPMARRDDRIAEEIAFHIEQQTAKHIAAGMSPEDALRAARLKFGGVAQVREATRDELRGAWLRDLGRDLRLACRSLARVPSFSVTAILTIGLGIGAAAAMFTVVDGVLLRPLPYPEADRIVQLFQIGDQGRRGANVSEPTSSTGRRRRAASRRWPKPPRSRRPSSARRAQSVPVAMVSQGFFDVMGTRPARGPRVPRRRAAARGRARGAGRGPLLERWKGDRPLSGESIVIGGVAHAVVGVMPPGFSYPRDAAIWTPREQGLESPSRTAHNFRVVGGSAPGSTSAAASAELSRVSRAMKVRYGSETTMSDAVAVPILDVMTARVRPALRLLLAASLLLLLVACTNVSNLLVARAASRQREFAVQLALGASVGRMTRQWLAETHRHRRQSARWSVSASRRSRAGVRRDGTGQRAAAGSGGGARPAVAFAAASAAGVALVLSLLTAWGTRSVRIADALSDGTRGGTSSRRQMRAPRAADRRAGGADDGAAGWRRPPRPQLCAGHGRRSRVSRRRRPRDPDVHRAGRRGRSGPARVDAGGAARSPPRAARRRRTPA